MQFFLPGQRRAVSVELTVPSVEAALSSARSAADASVKRDRLRMRLHDDGTVRCHKVRSGKNTPPHFRGHLRNTGKGIVLEGVIRESRSSGFMTATYAVLALLLLVMAVVCAVSRPVVVPGLVVCGFGAPALGALSFALRRSRAMLFRFEAPELESKIRQYFGAAPLPRPALPWERGNR